MASSNFRGTSSLLLVVAVAAMGGLFFWLYQQTRALDETVTPVTEDTAAGEGEGITLEELREAPRAAAGETGILNNVAVEEPLGRGVFTVQLDEELFYPVLMSTDLMAQGVQVYGGARVTVGGQFYVLTDSIRDQWLEGGAVDPEQAERLPEAESFLLADSVDIQ